MPSSMEELEKKLPFLPGHTFSKQLDNYRKSHAFDYLSNVPVTNDDKPGIGAKTPMNVHHRAPEQDAVTSVSFLKDKSVLDAKSKVAGWIALDKQVLRFHAYFREESPNSPTEAFRIRKANIYFYLEDDSIHVSEPREINSGMPQGTLIRRHRIPIPGHPKNQHYTIADLNVGVEISIYARNYKIVGCDEFTRRFLSSLDIPVGANTKIPDGPYQQQHSKETAAPKSPAQRLVPTRHDTSLKKFLENDRKVLRFYCVWDDSNAKFGDVHPMILHYFLADDTIEIREQHVPQNMLLRQQQQQQGSSSDAHHLSIPTTVFLKRHRLSKLPLAFSVDGSHLASAEVDPSAFYSDKDLTVGSVVHLYGRTFVICDCDAFTKEYYRAKYGVSHFAPLDLQQYGHIDAETGAVVTRPASNNTAVASVDPDMVMRFSTVNNAPKTDKKKGVAENLILRFVATLKSNKQVDKDRKFVLSYFFVNDSFQIFEKQQKNSGITGGKFLERSKVKKADGSGYYGPADLHIGAELQFWSHHFVIVDADAFSKQFMAQNKNIFTAYKG